MIDLRADRHTHTTWSDGADDLARMLDAARQRDLRVLGVSDHVRADTTWAPEYVRAVRALGSGAGGGTEGPGPRVEVGVEVKILDTREALDLPTDLPELDYVLIADHRLPGRDGPLDPAEVARGVAEGGWRPADVVETLLEATVAALPRSPAPPILAHLFSVLPKCGVTEADVSPDARRALALACADAGARVEVNEKWRCPGAPMIAALVDAGVPVLAASDAHRARDVARWDHVAEVAAAW